MGYHQFLLHPIIVALAWWKLYGFPMDPRLWAAFFLHDVGYLGKPDMDGQEGTLHPFEGAHVMHFLFDRPNECRWYHFCLYHSRSLAKLYFAPLSDLCYADKAAFLLYPEWLLRVLYWLSGEGAEYLHNFGSPNWKDWYKRAFNGNVRMLKEKGLIVRESME
jgi:hypothetical protein